MTSLEVAVIRLTYVEAVWLLRKAEVPCLAIKGPVTSMLLGQPARLSADADILVSPNHFDRALRALRERGWVVRRAGLPPQEAVPHSATLQRQTDILVGPELDLHRAFPGFDAPEGDAWDVLWRDRTAVALAHCSVAVPSAAAALLFIALHAARSGVDVGKPLNDLRRALDVVPMKIWTDAALLAEELEATAALSAGLSLVPEGQELAGQLELPAPNLEWQLRSRGNSSIALFLLGWWRAPWRAKLPLLAREVWPTTAFMRIDWLSPDDVRRSGLVRAHLRRWWSLTRRIPGAFRALARAWHR